MCQDEMRFHSEFHTDPNEAGNLPTNDIIAIGKVPIGGGSCTPTVNVFNLPPGGMTADSVEEMQPAISPAFVVEGPTCFGGMYDWCCDTTFHVSRNAGAQDMATIIKKKPEDCSQMCRACCTTADIYDMHIKPEGNVTGMEKAIIMGELAHLDFMFFERDQFPITCDYQPENKTMIITCLLCLCYCYGCLCPIKCCCPLKMPEGN